MRIRLASSGYYYVQKYSPYSGWKKVGGFFSTRAGARRFARDYQYVRPFTGRTVEYVY